MRRISILLVLLVTTGCKPATRVVTGDVFIVTKAGPSIKLGLVGIMVYPLDSTQAAIAARQSHVDSLVGSAPKDLSGALMLWVRMNRAVDSVTGHAANGMCGFAWEHHHEYLYPQCTPAMKAAALPLVDSSRHAQHIIDSLKPVMARLGADTFWLASVRDRPATTTSDADGHFTFTLPRSRPVAVLARATRELGTTTESLVWLVRFDPAVDSTLRLSNDNLITSPGDQNLLSGKITN